MTASIQARGRAAFTLVEVLVVLLIVILLLGVAAAIFGPDNGMPLQVGSEEFAALATAARERSLTTGNPVCLAIRVGSSDPERDLREVLRLERSPDDSAWIPSANSSRLPEGIWLDAVNSSGLIAGSYLPPSGDDPIPFLGVVFLPGYQCPNAGARIRLVKARPDNDGSALDGTEAQATIFAVSRTGHFQRLEPRSPAP